MRKEKMCQTTPNKRVYSDSTVYVVNWASFTVRLNHHVPSDQIYTSIYKAPKSFWLVQLEPFIVFFNNILIKFQ
jgi:hypothetical protein